MLAQLPKFLNSLDNVAANTPPPTPPLIGVGGSTACLGATLVKVGKLRARIYSEIRKDPALLTLLTPDLKVKN